jgi:RNA polymerase sigma factor (sigma-70 family)
MATATLGGFLQHLRKAMAAETLASLSDCELVERFLASHDEASFQALLQRHGPMVLRVCRRALPDEQDVEDAFQATFLVLARDARAIRKHESLANWLHGVAYRVALDVQKARARRRKFETKAPVAAGTVTLTDEVSWKELRSVLDAELVRLPEGLRAPLVLCYLEGLTQDEAAARLGQSKSTFRRNLERGRELLGGRLTRRGVTLSAALFAPLLSECAAAAAVPAALVASTTEAAAALAAGKAVATAASARSLVLAEGFVRPLLFGKVKCVGVLVLAALVAGLGGATLTGDARPVEPQQRSAPDEGNAPAVAKAPTPDREAERAGIGDKDGPRVFSLMLAEKVWAGLHLSPEQTSRIAEKVLEADRRNKDAFDRLTRIQANKARAVGDARASARAEEECWATINAARRDVLGGILTPAQFRRLQQLELHAAGLAAFFDPDVESALVLTDEQKVGIRSIAREPAAAGPDPKGAADIYPDVFHTRRVPRVLQLLRADQRSVWAELTGESFELRTPDFQPGSAPVWQFLREEIQRAYGFRLPSG